MTPGSTTPPPPTRQRVDAAWRNAVDGAATPGLNATALAIGWATVELDRAAAELAEALGLGGVAPFRSAPRSVALGCACRIARAVLPGGGSLLLLEPDTEGRVAGSLARRGEGPVAAWLTPQAPGAPHGSSIGRLTLSSERDGPLGGERLVVEEEGGVWGLHRLVVVRPAGTIHP